MPHRRHHHPSAALALALLVSIASEARAQDAAPRGGELRGTIFASVGPAGSDSRGAPLPGATIIIGELGRSVRADSTGRFTIAGVPAGTYRVFVRNVGFEPLESRARFADGATTDLEFALHPAAPQLTRVLVAERASAGIVGLDEQYARQWGKLIDQDELAKNPGRRISDMLAQSGIRIVPLVDQRSFQSRQVAASRRGMASVNGPRDCFMTVILDGITLFAPSTAQSAGQANVMPPDVNMVDLTQLAAIEVYSGAAQLPAELRGSANACGVVRMWTRRQ